MSISTENKHIIPLYFLFKIWEREKKKVKKKDDESITFNRQELCVFQVWNKHQINNFFFFDKQLFSLLKSTTIFFSPKKEEKVGTRIGSNTRERIYSIKTAVWPIDKRLCPTIYFLILITTNFFNLNVV